MYSAVYFYVTDYLQGSKGTIKILGTVIMGIGDCALGRALTTGFGSR